MDIIIDVPVTVNREDGLLQVEHTYKNWIVQISSTQVDQDLEE